jgi:hypothetical protein
MLIAQQAIVLGVCNFIILLSVVLSLFVIKKDTDQGDKTGAIWKNIAALIMFVTIMALQIYSLNCMVYGDCNIWAWIIAAFAIVGTVSYLGLFAYVATSAQQLTTMAQNVVYSGTSFSTPTMSPSMSPSMSSPMSPTAPTPSPPPMTTPTPTVTTPPPPPPESIPYDSMHPTQNIGLGM